MKNFKGTITALVTPFFQGKIDFPSLEQLIKDQIRRGVTGFVISGTTGESPTLNQDEKKAIFDFVKKNVPDQITLIMGTGSNSTQKTIEDSRLAEKWGADGILVVVPYYNKPPQRGLFEHFKAVASSVQIPVILYNVPGRTVASLEVDTIKKLSELPNVIGIKEATGNIEFAKQIKQACGDQFIMLSGDDGTLDEFMKVGGHGVISVASHIIPEAMSKLIIKENRDLIDMLFIEANPIPIKMALYLTGVIRSPELRLPLVELSQGATEKLKKLMTEKGLLK
ncbi:MAG: 4-hydroxy-tetrahydrodipicolinate synthase [Oligoflexia bacterium]|nr:MAG: 4-hydroxy-tetrahydrodipicolinate synthase [Oligoflexia bacterium]